MYKVLIVDDERLIRITLKNMMDWQAFDCEVIATAKDGEEALKLIDEYDIDLVYLDVMMPKKDGYEVCEVIRKDKLKDKTYIVLLT
ncbi:MAG: response regulator, partial [Longicatena sp.]